MQGMTVLIYSLLVQRQLRSEAEQDVTLTELTIHVAYKISIFPRGMHTPHVGRVRVCAKEPLRVARTMTIAAMVFMVLLEKDRFQGVTREEVNGRLDERKLIRVSSHGILISSWGENIDNRKGFIVSLFIARSRRPVIRLLANESEQRYTRLKTIDRPNWQSTLLAKWIAVCA